MQPLSHINFICLHPHVFLFQLDLVTPHKSNAKAVRNAKFGKKMGDKHGIHIVKIKLFQCPIPPTYIFYKSIYDEVSYRVSEVYYSALFYQQPKIRNPFNIFHPKLTHVKTVNSITKTEAYCDNGRSTFYSKHLRECSGRRAIL